MTFLNDSILINIVNFPIYSVIIIIGPTHFINENSYIVIKQYSVYIVIWKLTWIFIESVIY